MPVATEENHGKPQVMIVNIPGEILTKDASNASQECYRYTNPFRPHMSKSKFGNQIIQYLVYTLFKTVKLSL
jgi:hypothetical protein